MDKDQGIPQQMGEHVHEVRLLQEIAKLAFSDIRDVFRPDGSLIPFRELPPDVAAAVVSMESSEVVLSRAANGGEEVIKRTVKVVLADKVKNLELLARHYGLLSGEDTEGDAAEKIAARKGVRNAGR